MRRTLRRACASLAAIGAFAAFSIPLPAASGRTPADSALYAKEFPRGIDAYTYEPAHSCQHGPRPGIEGFRDLALEAFPMATDAGIYNCRSIRGGAALSDHAEARAWDMGLDANDPVHLDAANAVIARLLDTDEHGNRHAMARRLGIQLIIWNGHFWRADQADAGMQPYPGSNPHRDHIHFSFTWAGARAETTYWTAEIAAPDEPDAPFRIGDVNRHPAVT